MTKRLSSPFFGFCLTLLALCLGMRASAQEDTFYRLELGGGLGAGFSLNDVNSRFYGAPNVSLAGVARFPLTPRMAIKTQLSYLGMGATLKDGGDFYPADLNLSGPERLSYKVSGGLVDASALLEVHFLPYGWAQGYQQHKRWTPYLQLGLGFAYATPGKAFVCNVPMGIGVKWKVNERINLNLDWTFHFTGSDNLEGLSAPHGINSSEFRNKDHYSFTCLTLTYDLSPRCPTCNKD